MSEKYVKEILEKLEEIEKLHAKLRSLVPRAKNHEFENKSNDSRKRSINVESDHRSVVDETKEKEIDSSEKEPEERRRDSLKDTFRASITRIKNSFDSDGGSMKYLKNFKDRSSNKFQRVRSNSIGYVTQQWKDKNERIKDFLWSLNQPDIILVTRAMQTMDGEVNIISEAFQRRRSTVENISEWLLTRFGNQRDSNSNHSTTSVHGRGLGSEPRKVQRTLFVPDKESETLKVLSSARKVSVSENRKPSFASSKNKTRKLSGKFTDIRLEQ